MNYQLEKYKGLSSRHQCPQCGDKKSFTFYVDEFGNILNKTVGRCNHESGCGYHLTPKDFFQYNDEQPYQREKNTFLPPSIPKKQTDFLPIDTLKRYRSNESDLITFLSSLTEKAEDVAEIYLLGAIERDVIFFQIDKDGNLRTGKVMKYSPLTGKRDKSSPIAVDWLHSRMKKSGKIKEDFSLSQCLFGEHLLEKYPKKSICLVESEKTALIASCVFPDFIWVATGGMQNFSDRLLSPLKNRRITVFPDSDAMQKWSEKAEELNAKGYSLRLSTLMKNEPKESRKDIADFLIENFLNPTLSKCYWLISPEYRDVPIYIAEYSNGKMWVWLTNDLSRGLGYQSIADMFEKNPQYEKQIMEENSGEIPDYVPFN